jgi:tRNA(fMet)-specific endonuclease VapC
MGFAVVIDSCVFIRHFRSKDKDNSFFMKLIEESEEVYVSAIAKYEVLIGDTEESMDEWRQMFEGIKVLPFDDSTILTARDIHRQLKRENKLIDLGDILVAATAIVHDLPLATFDRNHFERIRDLRLV